MGIQSSKDQRGPAEASPTPFSIDRQTVTEGCLQIRIGGELDLSTADRVAEVLDEALSSQAHVVLDLQPCSFLDSTGIATILCAHRRLAERGRVLCVVGASDNVARVLDITGLLGSDLVKQDLKTALLACGLAVATV